MSKDNKTKKNRRRWMIGGAMALVAVLVIGGFLLARRNARAQTAVNSGDIVTAFIGDLTTGATATGEIASRRDAQLALTASGIVDEIYVEVGDTVAAGDSLLKLDTTALERAVASAQQSLIVQENNLATLLAPAATAEIASAEAAVANARAALTDLEDGPNEDEVAAAEAAVRAANADVAAAQARLNNLTETANPDALQAAQIELELAQQAATEAAQQHSTILVTEPSQFLGEGRLEALEISARTAALQANARLAEAERALSELQNGDLDSIAATQAGVAAAVAQRDVAQAQLDLLLAGPTEAQIAAAKLNLAQAEASLDQLLRGPTQLQITQAEVAVAQARVALQQAENNLARATLTAPFAGTITAVGVREGEVVSGSVIEMVDSNNLEVALSVDEVDLADLEMGQPATITLETWPDEEIAGQVVAIAPAAEETTSALVTYEVYLSLGETELPILVGMTANADLVTSRRQDVLLLPNAAINVDRQAGTYSVNLVSADENGNLTTEAVEVSIGLRDGQYTQITGGLEEGDEVLVGDNLPVQRFGPGGDGPPPGGGPFGGGG